MIDLTRSYARKKYSLARRRQDFWLHPLISRQYLVQKPKLDLGILAQRLQPYLDNILSYNKKKIKSKRPVKNSNNRKQLKNNLSGPKKQPLNAPRNNPPKKRHDRMNRIGNTDESPVSSYPDLPSYQQFDANLSESKQSESNDTASDAPSDEKPTWIQNEEIDLFSPLTRILPPPAALIPFRLPTIEELPFVKPFLEPDSNTISDEASETAEVPESYEVLDDSEAFDSIEVQESTEAFSGVEFPQAYEVLEDIEFLKDYVVHERIEVLEDYEVPEGIEFLEISPVHVDHGVVGSPDRSVESFHFAPEASLNNDPVSYPNIFFHVQKNGAYIQVDLLEEIWDVDWEHSLQVKWGRKWSDIRYEIQIAVKEVRHDLNGAILLVSGEIQLRGIGSSEGTDKLHHETLFFPFSSTVLHPSFQKSMEYTEVPVDIPDYNQNLWTETGDWRAELVANPIRMEASDKGEYYGMIRITGRVWWFRKQLIPLNTFRQTDVNN